MKRLLLIISCLFLLFSSSDAMMLVGGRPATVACTVDTDSQQWKPVGQDEDAQSNATWKAVKFTLSAATTITMYRIKECDNASPGGANVDALIMNHDAGNDYPDETSVVADSTVNMLSTAITDCDSPTQDDYELATPIELSAGTYWLVIEEKDSAVQVQYYDNNSAGDRICYSENQGSTWNCNNNYAYDVEIWGCL